MKKLVTGALGACVLIIGNVGLVAPASAALPTCNVSAYRDVSGGYKQSVPGYEKLSPRYTRTIDCTLRRGSKGNWVWQLQLALNECYKTKITEKAVYGPQTEAAVRLAQKAAGLKPDGVYAPQTRDKIKLPTFGNGKYFCRSAK